MLASNSRFIPTVNAVRSQFLKQNSKHLPIYFSKHFFERVVERNLELEIVHLYKMAERAVQDMMNHNFSTMIYKITWHDITIWAVADVGKISEKRRLVLKTVFDNNTEFEYDMEITLT